MASHAQTPERRTASERSAWRALASHYPVPRSCTCGSCLRTIPSAVSDGDRGCGLYLDYSKNRVTEETLKLLVQLAEESGLRERIDAMFRGEKINITEKRAVLQSHCVRRKDASILVDGKNVVPEVHAVLDKMADFAIECGAVRGKATPENAFERRQYRHRRLRSRARHGL